MDYRDVIYQQLKAANERTESTYKDVMASYVDLLDSVVYLKSYIKKLEGAERTVATTVLSPAAEVSNDKLRQTEQQLLELQHERAEFYKRKGESAEALLELNRRLEKKEEERVQCSKELSEVKTKLSALEVEHQRLQEKCEELVRLNQCLKDDNIVLLSTSSALEEANRKLTVDNAQLLERWKSLNQREADILNLQNELQSEIQNLRVQRQLAEASKPFVDIDIAHSVIPSIAVCDSSLVPTRHQMKFEAHEGEVLALAWVRNRNLLVTGGTDRRLKIWEIGEGKHRRLEALTGCNQAIICIDVSLDDAMVLAGSNDFATRVWSLGDYRLRHTLTGHSGKVLCAKFSENPNTVVSGSNDRTLKIWDLQRRACFKTLFPASSCNDLVLTGGSSMTIISGHFDKKIRFWDYRCDSVIKEIDMPAKITSLDISRNQLLLLCATRDDSLHGLDLRNDQIIHTFTADEFKIGYDFVRAHISPDGRYCVCGSATGGLYVWDVNTGQVECSLSESEAPSSCITSAAWNGQGTSVATCDRNKCVSIWI